MVNVSYVASVVLMDCVLGLVMATQAAGLGSEVGAYQIGQSFFKGSCGLQKDPSQARFWLKKVVDRLRARAPITEQVEPTRRNRLPGAGRRRE